MNLVFNLDNVICTPAKGIKFGMADYIKNVLPIEDTTDFMQWCKKRGHHITIWCERPNDLAVKVATETWLEINQVPYDRLLFDRPENFIDVDEAPSHAKFYKHITDMSVVAQMYEEWKHDRQKESSEISRQKN
tara:strand:- start:596 stop:994 length:399 start_codon:yes stop_codon:yes gene_type:complete